MASRLKIIEMRKFYKSIKKFALNKTTALLQDVWSACL
tara:strand:- start:1480 stop:1593 length:114 start_codon:yes stop_codon:yes gene_type:complete